MNPSIISMQTTMRIMQTTMQNMQTTMNNMQNTMQQCEEETQAAAESAAACGGTSPAVMLVQYIAVVMLIGCVLFAFALITQYWNDIREQQQKRPIPVATVVSIVCVVINVGIFLLLL